MTRAVRNSAVLALTGDDLTLADADAVLHGRAERLSLAPAARRRVEQARRCVVDLLERGETLYGVNTGFGKLANQRIAPNDVLALQENLLRSHAVGVGPLLGVGVSRLALALRIQALAKGYSGVTVELIDALHRDVQPRRRSRHPGAGQRRRQRRPRAAGPPRPRRRRRGPCLRRAARRRRRPARRSPAAADEWTRRPPPRPPQAVPAPGQGRAVAHQRHADQHRPPGRRPGPRLPAAPRRRRGRCHDRRGDEEFAGPLRPAHPGRAAASGTGRVRRQPAASAGRQRDHGFARRLRQSPGRLQPPLHARRSTAPTAMRWITPPPSSSAR